MEKVYTFYIIHGIIFVVISYLLIFLIEFQIPFGMAPNENKPLKYKGFYYFI